MGPHTDRGLGQPGGAEAPPEPLVRRRELHNPHRDGEGPRVRHLRAAGKRGGGKEQLETS